MTEHSEQAEPLFDAGVREQITLQLLIESGRAPHESIGFHAQQACEKFIKTVLVLHGVRFERTHDLVVLSRLITDHNIAIPVPAETLRRLNTYAVQFRYEACPVEMIAMEAAQQAVAALLNWASKSFEE